jgi:hypothetical protein
MPGGSSTTTKRVQRYIVTSEDGTTSGMWNVTIEAEN